MVQPLMLLEKRRQYTKKLHRVLYIQAFDYATSKGVTILFEIRKQSLLESMR